MKAKGYYDPVKNQWNWENVSWEFCEKNKLYKSNRGYPQSFWTKTTWSPKRKHTAGVVLLKYTPDGYKVLIVQCYDNKFGFPKGTCNYNETFKDAAVRELQEEIGIRININDYNSVQIPIKHYSERKIVFYVVFVDDSFEITTFPSKGLGDVEITAFGWVKLEDLCKFKTSHITKKTCESLLSIIPPI
jgi:8-oxo-dGTP pyrophosphatase MutT (NUDIX family)